MKGKLMISWRINFIRLNFKKYLSFPGGKISPDFNCIHLDKCSCSSCHPMWKPKASQYVWLPSQQWHSLSQSTHLNFHWFWTKQNCSGVQLSKTWKGLRVFCVHYTTFQLSTGNSCDLLGIILILLWTRYQMIFFLWINTFLLVNET